SVPELIILPIYSMLPLEVQSHVVRMAQAVGPKSLVFSHGIPRNKSNNVTIPGIYYVIDPGFAKQNTYNPCLGMNSLVVLPVLQAQVRQ
ncbi:ATP dependent helicase, partial [Lactarius pseudohatsudake]